MGYDMYIEADLAPGEQAAFEQAQAAVNEAVAARDVLPRPPWNPETRAQEPNPEYDALQKAVSDAFDRLSATQLNYFRANIWGMQTLRAAMARFKMVKEGWSEWPDPPYEGENPVMDQATFETIQEYDEDAIDAAEFAPEHVKAYQEYQAAVKRALSMHDGDTPGIGINKFGSNDGWIVTPGECWSAAELWDKTPREEQDAGLAWAAKETGDDAWEAEELREWFERWVAFLKRAKQYGGFRVY